MRIRTGLLLGAFGLAMAPAIGLAQNSSAAASVAAAPSQALADLFARSDQASLERNPIRALMRGDTSRAGVYVDSFSDAYRDAERAAAQEELAALLAIDRSSLNATDQIAYDVFKWQKERQLRALAPEIEALSAVRPVDHFNGFHTSFARLSSGQGIARYNTTADYDAGLSRFDGFIAALGSAQMRMEQGMATGVVQPRLVMENVVQQLDAMLAKGVEGSDFYLPITKFPEGVPPADQQRLRAAYADAVGTRLFPALTRFRDFVRDTYLPATRTSVGLLDMPGGDLFYRERVIDNTTTDMTPEQIHQIGLDQVKYFHAEMNKVKEQVGFTGTLQEFFEHIRTDPKFKPESREWLQQAYVEIGERVAPALPKLFAHQPKASLEIRPVPALTEQGAARGSYQSGTPDGSRPGVFYFNAYDLPSRTTPSMETLYLHEGAPGHHFQRSLSQENEALPDFMRFGGGTVFTEGWGLYAETLGRELGVYTDPYQYFGYLDSQLFRAIRLVVDTGIHSKGWGRDQTIQYILDNSSRGRSNATAETERYIAMPGQALSYMIGQLKISELRARSEKALGDRFDIRAFHDQVLNTGALPLAVLEAKIDAWIASQKA